MLSCSMSLVMGLVTSLSGQAPATNSRADLPGQLVKHAVPWVHSKG
jgi:hypothetical protein